MQTRKTLPPQRVAPKSRAIRVLNTLSIGLLAAAMLATLAAVLFMMVIEPRRAVAEVRLNGGDNKKITVRAFQERLVFERARAIHRRKIEAAKVQHPFDETSDVDYRQLSTRAFAGGILDRMTREILIEEAAAAENLSANAEEIDRIMDETDRVILAAKPIQPAPGATLDAATTMAPSAVPAKASGEVLRIKMDPREVPQNYREIIRTEVLENKLRNLYFERIPQQEERVQLRMVRFELETEAVQAAKVLSHGESFEELYNKAKAGAVSDASVMAHEWSSATELQRDFNPAFSHAVFQLSEGSHFAEPIGAARGWYLAEAAGRGVRPLSEDWRRQRGEDAFQRWLEGQQSRIIQFPVWMKKVPLHPKAGRRGLAPSEMPPVNLPGGADASSNRLKNGPKGKAQDGRPIIPQRTDATKENVPRGGDRSDPRHRAPEGGMKIPTPERNNQVPHAP